MSELKTYWDFTEKERSEMKEADETALLSIELMTKGVTNPEIPAYEKELEILEMPKRKLFYQVGDLVFDTIEKAETVRGLNPQKYNYNWNIGDDYKYAENEDGGSKVTPINLFNKLDLDKIKMVLEKNKEIKKENERRRAEYEKEYSKAEKVTSGVWADWYDVQAKRNKHTKIINTLAEYKKMTGNDTLLACKFLSKAFSEEEIAGTIEWLGENGTKEIGLEIIKEEINPNQAQ